MSWSLGLWGENLKVGMPKQVPFRVPTHRSMAPKEWCNEVTITDASLTKIMVEHCKQIEREGWKAMNSEEFVAAFLPLLKSVGAHTLKLNRSDVRKALARGHLKMSAVVMDHFSQKLCDAIKYVKRRLRQKGSGVRLPAPCRILFKVVETKNMT